MTWYNIFRINKRLNKKLVIYFKRYGLWTLESDKRNQTSNFVLQRA